MEPFAKQLSKVRTWGAAVMLVTGWYWLGRGRVFDYDSYGAILLPIAVFPGLIIALLLGKAWARVLLLGWSVSIALFWLTVWLYSHPDLHGAGSRLHRLSEGAWTAHAFGAIVLAPWHRRDLSRQGWVLALIPLALQLAWFQSRTTEHAGLLATVALAFSAIGAVYFARWSRPLAIIAGGLLLVGALDLWKDGRFFLFGHSPYDATRCLSPRACTAVGAAFLVQLFGVVVTTLVAAVLVRSKPVELARERRDDAGPALPDLRRRWAVLFASAMTCLVALSWITGGFAALQHGGMRVVAISVCAAIGVLCAMTNTQRRWPAVVAVGAASMVALDLADVIPYWSRWSERAGAAGILLLAGTVAMVASALYVAIRKLPAPPPIPLARPR